MQKRGAETGLALRHPRVVGQHGVRVWLGIELNCRGPNFGVVSACASGTHAIGEAMLAIQRGDADIIICGGSEAAMTPLMYGGFGAMKAMCTQFNETPEKQAGPSTPTGRASSWARGPALLS